MRASFGIGDRQLPAASRDDIADDGEPRADLLSGRRITVLQDVVELSGSDPTTVVGNITPQPVGERSDGDGHRRLVVNDGVAKQILEDVIEKADQISLLGSEETHDRRALVVDRPVRIKQR